MNKHRKQEGSKVTYETFQLQEMEVFLRTCIKDNILVPSDVFDGAVTSALFSPHLGKNMDADKLIESMNDKAGELLSRLPSSYTYMCSLSCRNMPDKVSYVANNLQFHSSGPKKISARFDRIKREVCRVVKHYSLASESLQSSWNYPLVTMKLKARSIWEAYQEGQRSLDIVRAILNLHENMHTNMRISSGRRNPVNKLLLGPIHTVHDSKGRIQDDIFWQEEDFRVSQNLFDYTKRENRRKTFYDSAHKLLRQSRLRAEAEEALIRYCRALDDRDWVNSFKQLWSKLEYCTGSSRMNYDHTIKRAASAFGDYQYFLEMGKHLRDRRNALVHARYEEPQAEILLFQLKRLVEPTLVRLVRNSPRFDSIEDFGSYLEQPRDMEMLKRKSHVLISAIKYSRLK